jgi:glycosyltransferase involved in cell wall biosynthesis
MTQTAAESDRDTLVTVDVVIATHNRPELLRKAVDAVVGQTYPGHVTCVVVFDQAEPDASLALEQPARTVIVVPNSRTVGLAGARNTGVAAGRSQMIGFCDDDDEWLETKLEKQIDLIQRSGADTCVTGITIQYDDRSVSRVPTPERVRTAELIRNRSMEAHPSSVLVTRSGMERIGPVDEAIPGSFGEDYDWILRAAKDGPVAVVEEPLVNVRWGGSLFSKKWGVIVEALDYLVAKHPEFRTDRRALGRILGQKSFALAASGERWPAVKVAVACLRSSPKELRAYLAIAVALGLTTPNRVMHEANKRGKGI